MADAGIPQLVTQGLLTAAKLQLCWGTAPVNIHGFVATRPLAVQPSAALHGCSHQPLADQLHFEGGPRVLADHICCRLCRLLAACCGAVIWSLEHLYALDGVAVAAQQPLHHGPDIAPAAPGRKHDDAGRSVHLLQPHDL